MRQSTVHSTVSRAGICVRFFSVAVVLLTLCAPSFGQENVQTIDDYLATLQLLDLHGPVRRIESIITLSDSPDSTAYVEEFNRAGRRTRMMKFRNGTMVQDMMTEYDSLESCIRTRVFEPSGGRPKPTFDMCRCFDDDRRLIYTEELRKGKLYAETFHQYPKRQYQQTQIRYYRGDTTEQLTWAAWSDKADNVDAVYSYDGEGTARILYSAVDTIVAEQFGEPVRREIDTLYYRGRLMSITQKFRALDDGRILLKGTYLTYTSVKPWIPATDTVCNTVRYRYNDHGDIIEQAFFSHPSSLDSMMIPVGKANKIMTFEYQYDTYGNWEEEIYTYRQNNGEANSEVRKTTTTRIITYDN